MTIRFKVTEDGIGGTHTERDLTLGELSDLLTGNPPNNSFVTVPFLQDAGVHFACNDVLVSTATMLAAVSGGVLAFYQPVSDGVLSFTSGVLSVTPLVDNSIQTYSPLLFNAENVEASEAYVCGYYRVGNIITVYGRVDVNPTTGGLLTRLGIELPEPSVFLGDFNLAGTAFASGIAGQGAAVRGDPVNNRAEMIWISGDVTNQAMYFHFSYTVMTQS